MMVLIKVCVIDISFCCIGCVVCVEVVVMVVEFMLDLFEKMLCVMLYCIVIMMVEFRKFLIVDVLVNVCLKIWLKVVGMLVILMIRIYSVFSI